MSAMVVIRKAIDISYLKFAKTVIPAISAKRQRLGLILLNPNRMKARHNLKSFFIQTEESAAEPLQSRTHTLDFEHAAHHNPAIFESMTKRVIEEQTQKPTYMPMEMRMPLWISSFNSRIAFASSSSLIFRAHSSMTARTRRHHQRGSEGDHNPPK